MPKHLKKGDLPTKICQHCGLPFTWRKKWTRDWENIRYCSERCKRGSKEVKSVYEIQGG
ncbi:MAG: DUF2256 domain-containing protein [Trueperaceae bacterium]